MRTFVIRARKGTTQWEKIRQQMGGKEHFEVVVHTVLNAFFISNDFRKNVEVYIVLDSSEDFPRTIKLSAAEGLSLSGFHETAVLDLIERVLKESGHLRKDETQFVAPGVQISGFGFEKLIAHLLQTQPVYLLQPKGVDIRTSVIADNPVFILSDHIPLPPKNIKSLKHKGLQTLSLGKKMLFASQCVVLINDQLDRNLMG
jgi:tRNA (pseudouridine54-N1)-methyltransferase